MTSKGKYGSPGRQGFLSWMDGYCDAFDDLPDGAGQSACETAVGDYNLENGTKLDQYDGWLEWVTARSKV